MIRSGLEQLDVVLHGLRLGDNVVWQVDDLEDYIYFARPLARRGIADGYRCVYVRFAPHEPILEPGDGLEILEIDPRPGFDSFSSAVHRIIAERGPETFYVFDNLSALAVEWATDELLANFFQVTCPFLLELRTVAYFALTRGQHGFSAVARVRETTQVLINVYRVEGRMYVHPLKVLDRYSPQMFLPHAVGEDRWEPLFSSVDAAQVTAVAGDGPLPVEIASCAPWDAVYGRLVQHRRAQPPSPATSAEVSALKQEFSRMLIGENPGHTRLADRYLALEDLFRIRDRLVGSGRIGGKAAGMLLARRVLLEDGNTLPFSSILEDHDSFYIGSDVFFTYLVDNDLFRLRLQLVSDPAFTHEAFAGVEKLFLAGSFPPAILEQFRTVVDHYGQAPLIVRSSSLLEDSFGSAFAGKYRSEFCANQGSPQERLEAFLRAVKLVYASALNPDVLSYRRRRGLDESDEQMAILVQRVSGRLYHRLFFPPLAGVALSRNLYVWTDRIDPSRGIIRLVFGLGTRAVERVGHDYPRMIPVSHPDLRPEIGMKVAKYSQQMVDVIDLDSNRLTTLPFSQVVATPDYPRLELLVSEARDEHVYEPVGDRIAVPPSQLVLTFNNLVRQTDLVPVIGGMLAKLEEVHGHPVEIEFTASVDQDGQVRVNLLQCRPMWTETLSARVHLPPDLPEEDVLITSARFIGAGVADDIRYAVYVDPAAYATANPEEKRSIGGLVGAINATLRAAGSQQLLIGPGRFGSSNPDLGVSLSYADIDNTAVLVETPLQDSGQAPEVSYGTHFFQDLVEERMVYLALDPDDEASSFRRAFFERSPSCLSELVPEAGPLGRVVRLVDVQAVTEGGAIRAVADPRQRRAVCYLQRG
jgi:pyruvate,water dikinase